MSDREIKVSFPGGLRVNAEYKGFLIQTDQPVYAGGEETAPGPFDLFLVSIATCAGYYLLAFCRAREIPTDKAAVIMRMEKDPTTKMVAKILLELVLPPGFPEKYKKTVIRAVDQCTVKAHIINPPTFAIEARLAS